MNVKKDPIGTQPTKSLFTPQREEDATSKSLDDKRPPSTDPVFPPTQRLDFSGAAGANQEPQPDFDAMTIDALQSHRKEVERKIEEKQWAERRGALDQIVTLVKTHDIPVDDLVEALGGLKRRLGPAPQKYRDPETGATWSGRGKEPLWLRGKDRSKFRIP